MNLPELLTDGTKVYWGELPGPSKSSQRYFRGGETLITLGLILLLFVGYKTTYQDNVVGDNQTTLAISYEKSNNRFVPVNKVSKLGDIFAQIYVPRFAPTWTRLIAQGTKWHPVLNEIGVGHYIGTAMPGYVGNFAVAAHRGGFGGAFKQIHTLREGDRVYVKTGTHYFVYQYLQTKIVDPSDVSVIERIPPELAGAQKQGRYMTMTSCTPIFVNTQRIVVWLELVSKGTTEPEGWRS